MKIYIPFNSNDFNSVFTTLSISPYSFYANRKFSFKRASLSLLNQNEDYLIGYEKPTFHRKDFDKDYGFPVLLEIEKIDTAEEFSTSEGGLKYFVLDSTIYLVDDFRLIFRTQKELNETLAKSLKSIETKFSDWAKLHSTVFSSVTYVDAIPNITVTSPNENCNSRTFEFERKLNRVLGAILGSAIATTASISDEWQKITILLRRLNNNLSLYLNKIGESNAVEKTSCVKLIDEILRLYTSMETIDEAILLDSDLTTDQLEFIKKSKIFNLSTFSILIEGLLALYTIELPLSLQLQKLIRSLNSRYNIKFPSNYIDKINYNLSSITTKVDAAISASRKENILASNKLISFQSDGNELDLNIPPSLSLIENSYLKETLNYFIKNDSISSIEDFFVNRKDILIDLAKHFKSTVSNFDGSNERKYLINLLNSFDTLRGKFDFGATANLVLKSLAILFTSGRDLSRYIDGNEREGISNSIIYFSLWGTIFGASAFPKTLTESITENVSNTKNLMLAFKDAIRIIQATEQNSLPVIKYNNPKSDNYSIDTRVSESSLAEDDSHINLKISPIGYKILEQLSISNSVKLSDLMKISKSFKKQSDVENLIKTELFNKIKIVKRGRTVFAESVSQ